jgi:hypothetical protein
MPRYRHRPELTRFDWRRRRVLNNTNWSQESNQRARPHRSVSRTITGTGVRPGKPIPLPGNGPVRMSFCAAKPTGLALRSPQGRSWPSNGRCLKRLPRRPRRDDFAKKETSKRNRDNENETDTPPRKSQSSEPTKTIAAKNQTFTSGTPMHTLTQRAMKMLCGHFTVCGDALLIGYSSLNEGC